MNRLYRLVSIMILMCVVVGSFFSCDGFDSSSPKESEQMQATSTAHEKGSETEEETEEPNRLAKIIRISLDRYKGKCTFYWGDRNGQQSGKSVTGVTRFLYHTKKSNVYSEVTIASIGSSADGTGIAIEEGNELLYLIVVFQKGHKITDNEKNVLKELGIDYMFEK